MHATLPWISSLRHAAAWAAISTGLSVAAACRRDTARLEARERAEPHLQQAAARADSKDMDGAIRLYERALQHDPGLARAHLELALLLHDHVRDYVGAIYHYRRYEALRPDADKLALVRERRRIAEQALAAILQPQDPRGAPAGVTADSRDLAARLLEQQRDNEALRARVADLERQVQELRRQAAAALATPGVPPSAVAGASTARTYRVRQGDTLSSIASRVYGDASQWSRIYDANRSRLKTPTQLIEGMELSIP